MKRTAQATWNDGLKHGRGHLTTASEILAATPYSFLTRFGDEQGTNPEELIAAAHAGCFSMALALQLSNAGLVPEEIRTTAELSLEMPQQITKQAVPNVTGIHLSVIARVPGASDADFQMVAEQAKTGCLVSRMLNPAITLDARLDTEAPVLDR